MLNNVPNFAKLKAYDPLTTVCAMRNSNLKMDKSATYGKTDNYTL